MGAVVNCFLRLSTVSLASVVQQNWGLGGGQAVNWASNLAVIADELTIEIGKSQKAL